MAASRLILLGVPLVLGAMETGHPALLPSESIFETLAWLHESAVVTDLMASRSRTLDAALLLAAGAWQLAPAKGRCLAKCRSTLGFLMGEWREGAIGALVMGLRHGAFCVGCCWALMALLFVGGVMNLLWIGLLAGAVLLEKALPFGQEMAKVVGVALCAAGLAWSWW